MKSRTVYFRFLLIFLFSLLLNSIQYTTTNPWKIMDIPQNFLHYTLLFDTIGNGSQLYLFCLPLLACIGGSYLYSYNHISHFDQMCYARIGIKKYLRKIYIRTFFYSGISGVLPLLLSMLFAIMINPYFQKISITSNYPIIDNHSFLANLYDSSPIFVILFLVISLFVYSGLLGLLGIACASIYNKKHIDIFLPFVLLIVFYFIVSLLGQPEFACSIFFHVGISGGFPNTLIGMISNFILLFTVVLAILVKKVNADDL
ncbi:hypothetical protein [Enterococcus columbae]|uniref:Uncharacterized protein n=1 Tax=Enterococcus columbae DSM 7374 = ATCC 51263 TaxID=1121865 RepID=S1NPA0_9ENTE|nr:hypothetical protein [Enterococcus columbae]EOT44561.1 hypothetical protein OMW_00617 [Enterococcus columbae DSM 7374 = ATCC 51263]EOW87543.1 hypothetical protein I568_00587 [Enterococcus columbae DSM 7374 = ATCC 51263]